MKQMPVALKPRSLTTVARLKLALASRGGAVDVTNGCMPAINHVPKDKSCYRHCMGIKNTPRIVMISWSSAKKGAEEVTVVLRGHCPSRVVDPRHD